MAQLSQAEKQKIASSLGAVSIAQLEQSPINVPAAVDKAAIARSLGAMPLAAVASSDDRTAQQVADDQARSVIEGFKNVFRHPIDTVSGMVGGVAKGVEAYMQGGPYGLTPFIAEAAKPVTDLARGAAAYVAPNTVDAPTAEEFKQSAEFAGQNAALTLVGEGIAKTVPAVRAGASSARAAVENSGLPSVLRRAAEANRAAAKAPALPHATTPMAVIGAIEKSTRIPRAYLQEVIADWMTTPEGKLRTMRAYQAAQAEESARIHSLQPVQDVGGPSLAPPPEAPGVSARNQEFLDALREEAAVKQRVAEAQERAYANRNAEPKAALQEPPTAAPPSPGVSLLNREFLADIAEHPPQPGPSLTPEAVNKWIGVSPKEVMHGANPGQQLISENLIGETKAATKTNVDTALKKAGVELEARLKLATARGVTIDAQTPTYDAVGAATKRIGSPKDAAFQSQMNGILDDIEAKYPGLDKLSPVDAHKLKVELGDAIDWTGAGADTPANKAMTKIYRDINLQLKTIEGIGAAQDRWGGLHIASRNLKAAMAKDVVGSGTPASVREVFEKLRAKGMKKP